VLENLATKLLRKQQLRISIWLNVIEMNGCESTEINLDGGQWRALNNEFFNGKLDLKNRPEFWTSFISSMFIKLNLKEVILMPFSVDLSCREQFIALQNLKQTVNILLYYWVMHPVARVSIKYDALRWRQLLLTFIYRNILYLYFKFLSLLF
jgi:hypothetical protein